MTSNNKTKTPCTKPLPNRKMNCCCDHELEHDCAVHAGEQHNTPNAEPNQQPPTYHHREIF
jgi:hypothetical protein